MIPYVEKYRWFYTSGRSLVVGGKNAEQNDALLRDVLALKKELYVFHTSAPGSPFAVILKQKENVTSQECDEAAIFTGCFSRAWKEHKKHAIIDQFTTTQLTKERGMKTGMWRVRGKITHLRVELQLVLAVQHKTLRAVPPPSTSRPLLKIVPGTVDKSAIAAQIGVELGDAFTHDEIVSALPAGGVRKQP